MEVIAIQQDIAKLGLDLGGVMALVVERTLGLVNADGAAIELAEGEDMVYRAASGNAAAQIGLRLKRSHSLSGLCVAEGHTLRCDDSEADERADREACRKVGLRSMIVMPLNHKGETVGVLKAMSASPGKFSPEDESLLNLLSEVVAAAMFLATKYDKDDLFHQATHDGLTGLANRSLFMDRLRKLVSQKGRSTDAAGVLMIDMDGLKQINDTLGHRAGDAMIKELAKRILTVARHSDTVARLGGDEFGAILTPVDHPEGLDAAINRMMSEIAIPFRFENRELALSASIGAAAFPDEGDEWEGLLDLADQRMYAVKKRHHSRRKNG